MRYSKPISIAKIKNQQLSLVFVYQGNGKIGYFLQLGCSKVDNKSAKEKLKDATNEALMRKALQDLNNEMKRQKMLKDYEAFQNQVLEIGVKVEVYLLTAQLATSYALASSAASSIAGTVASETAVAEAFYNSFTGSLAQSSEEAIYTIVVDPRVQIAIKVFASRFAQSVAK